MTTHFLISQNLYHHLHGAARGAKLYYNFLNCQPSIFCDEHVSFLLIAFSSDVSWSNSMRQISIVLPSFQCFIQCVTLLAHPQESHRRDEVNQCLQQNCSPL